MPVSAFLRFDDLTSRSGVSFEFAEPGEILVATEIDEVRPALERADELRSTGWWLAGFVSYDAAPGIDPGLVVPPGRSSSDPPLVWLASFRERVEVAPPTLDHGEAATDPFWVPDVTPSDYVEAIAEIHEQIGNGETYQVNHTFRLRAPFTGDPFSFYIRIALAQHGGYCAYVDTGLHQIASASPERFFSASGRNIRVKPMKGTMRRGRWSAEDALLAEQLLRSEKERAENLMIVDLLRNDLGRIAEFGSVEARRLLDVERYDTVWQLTSEVTAVLRPGVGLAGVFGALFPSGSVTGAPKRRTMELISTLEASPRGIYCGAVGYVAPSDDGGLEATFNVAIRTAVVATASASIEYGLGGGITWDSLPGAEYEEAMLKSDVLRVSPAPEGLLETMRWDPEAGFWLEGRHLDRIEASAGYFGFRYDPAAVAGSLQAAVAETEGARVVRLTLDRNGRVLVTVGERLDAVGAPVSPGEGVRVAIADEPVSSQAVLLFHKTTERGAYERRKALHPDVDDVILRNERGEVTEATIANLAVRLGNDWVTPPLDSGCLPGTYRAALIDDGTLVEQVVSVEELAAADDIAVLNSVRGWRPAVLVPRLRRE